MTRKKRERNEIRERLCDELGLDPEALFMDGFDDCIAGAVEQFGRPRVVCYDLEQVLQKLEKQGMTPSEAEEWWSYNQVGAWVGEYTPTFIKFYPTFIRVLG